MASKKDFLAAGAKKTATGLFKDMSPLASAREEAKAEEIKVSTPEPQHTSSFSQPQDHSTEAQPQFQSIATQHQSTESQPQNQSAETQHQNTEPQPKHQSSEPAPVQKSAETKPEPVIKNTEEIVTESVNKKSSKEKTSRYEKDKFLLLDIRGYRDYIEHMAKAANMSATKYIRTLIENDRAVNNDIYLAHKELEEKLKNRNMAN